MLGTHVYFPAERPLPVVVVLGEHPDRGPKPVTSWQLSANLDLAEGDASRSLGADPRTANGRDGVMRIRGHRTVPLPRSVGYRRLADTAVVQGVRRRVSSHNLVLCEAEVVCREGRNEIKLSVLDL